MANSNFAIKELEMLSLIGKVSREEKIEIFSNFTHTLTDLTYFLLYLDETKPKMKPDFYLYRLIEILLPRAMCDKDNKKYRGNKKSQVPKLKMVELWA